MDHSQNKLTMKCPKCKGKGQYEKTEYVLTGLSEDDVEGIDVLVDCNICNTKGLITRAEWIIESTR